MPINTIKIGIASLDEEHTYTLYRNCEPITSVYTMAIRIGKGSSESVNKYNEINYISRYYDLEPTREVIQEETGLNP